MSCAISAAARTALWAIAVVLLICIAFGALTAIIARMKGRDPFTYFMLGFVLWWFGIIVSLLIPSIKIDDLVCGYLDSSNDEHEIVKGRLASSSSGLTFSSLNKRCSFNIPFQAVTNVRVLTRKARLPAFVNKQHMFGIKNLRVLEIVHISKTGPTSSYFSVYKTVIEGLRQRLHEIGIEVTYNPAEDGNGH